MQLDFKQINGFSRYWITNTGEVFVEPSGKKHSFKTAKFMSKAKLQTGYEFVKIERDDGIKVNKYIHRLVAEMFMTNPGNKKEVDHIDCNKSNNNLSNLRWATVEENRQYSWDQTRQKGGIKFIAKTGRYIVRITINNERKYIGSFVTRGEAERALKWNRDLNLKIT